MRLEREGIQRRLCQLYCEERGLTVT